MERHTRLPYHFLIIIWSALRVYMSQGVDACFLFILGLLVFIGGLGSILFYPNPRLIGLYIFLIVLGTFSIVLSLILLRQPISMALTYLRGPFYCIDCQSYVGQYEVTLTYRDGRSIIHQEPRFSNGICFSRGRLIEDGFRQRRCPYFINREL